MSSVKSEPLNNDYTCTCTENGKNPYNNNKSIIIMLLLLVLLSSYAAWYRYEYLECTYAYNKLGQR